MRKLRDRTLLWQQPLKFVQQRITRVLGLIG